jgi:hypothetical protein
VVDIVPSTNLRTSPPRLWRWPALMRHSLHSMTFLPLSVRSVDQSTSSLGCPLSVPSSREWSSTNQGDLSIRYRKAVTPRFKATEQANLCLVRVPVPSQLFCWPHQQQCLLLCVHIHCYLYYSLVRGVIAGYSGRAVWGVGLGRLVAGIVGSNPAQGMDVCPRLSVLYCPV